MNKIMALTVAAAALLGLNACGQTPAGPPAPTMVVDRLLAAGADPGVTSWLGRQDARWMGHHTPTIDPSRSALHTQNRPSNCGLPFNIGVWWYQICVDNDTWEYSIHRYYWW